MTRLPDDDYFMTVQYIDLFYGHLPHVTKRHAARCYFYWDRIHLRDTGYGV